MTDQPRLPPPAGPKSRRRAALIKGLLWLAAALFGAAVVYPLSLVMRESTATGDGLTFDVVIRGLALLITAIAGALSAMYWYEAFAHGRKLRNTAGGSQSSSETSRGHSGGASNGNSSAP